MPQTVERDMIAFGTLQHIDSRLRQLVGLRGCIGSSGDRKTHSELTVFRYSPRIFSTDCGRCTDRTEDFVFGVLMI